MKMSSQEVIETWANGEIIEMSSEQADSWREAVLDAVGSEPQNADPETFERDLLEFVREFYQVTSRESDRAALVRFVEKATLSNDDVNRAIAAGILYSFRKTPENAQRLLSFIEDPAEFPYLRAWFYLHPGIAARDPAVIDGIQRLLSNPETTEEVRLETLRMLGCNRDLFS